MAVEDDVSSVVGEEVNVRGSRLDCSKNFWIIAAVLRFSSDRVGDIV